MWLILTLIPSAFATWSIVAADPETEQIGGAGTSCVGDLDVAAIYGGAPGVGVVHAQARLNFAGRDEAVRRLGEGESPLAIVQAITAEDFDPDAPRRQYGVVDLRGRSAAYTGSSNGDWAGDQQGSADGIVYSAQGNILTGEGVVSRTAAAFEDSAACDLPERLLTALTAGSAASEGDSRCTDRGVPSDSAYLRVQGADGSMVVDLSVTGTGNEDPLVALRSAFDAWRVNNPCPTPEPEPQSEPTDEATGACGCASAPGSGLFLLCISGLMLARRRRT
ncbi:MAG: DUF1028 domain-containing protein [Myxococcota bacterium]